MKKIAVSAVVGGALVAGALGVAGPAAAITPAVTPNISAALPSGIDHLDWLDDIQPRVNVPRVDTTVRHNP